MVEKAGKGDWEIDWSEVWRKYRVPVSLGFIGLILVGIGTLSVLLLQRKEPEIEIIPLEKNQTSGTLFVDLEGAVEKPGLYELPLGSRINDLLVKAGGLSASADRQWVEKNVNLAQPLADGIKIYIPRQDEAIRADSGQVAGESASLTGLVNINSASASQLDTLWGIGPARAQDIIDGRPYQAIEELESKKVIPSNVFERIKDKISVY